MGFNEDLEALVKEIGTTPASASKPSSNKMTKSEFMSRYINDMYAKRYKERHNEAEAYLIESTISQKIKTDRSKRKGVLKYEY